MARGRRGWWLAAAAALMVAGCAGVITESWQEDGRVERVRVQGGEKWSVYDRNPLKEEGAGIMLKKESTF